MDAKSYVYDMGHNMNTIKSIITTAGASIISAASAANPLNISKVVIGQAVTSPTLNQVVEGVASANSIALVKYTADTNLFITHNLPQNSVVIRVKIPQFSTGYWVLQFGVYSGNTLIAICSVAAHQRTNADAWYEVILPATDITKFSLDRKSSTVVLKSSLTIIEQEINNSLTDHFPIGQEGSTPTGPVTGIRNDISRLVSIFPVVQSLQEMNQEKMRVVSMSDVFNNWYRFSHTVNGAQPAYPAEVSSWIYDGVSDQIQSTINSNSLIGFISRRRYENYELLVEVSAMVDGDDDDIGLVIGFSKDSSGYENTLTVVRSLGGFGHCFSLIKNYQAKKSKILVRGSGIAWGNGGYGLTATQAGYISNTAGISWKTMGKTRLSVVRSGNQLTIGASEFGPTNEVIKADAVISFDLTSDPDVSLFMGPQPYGYCALSQAGATFKVLKFTGEARRIVDVTNRVISVQQPNNLWIDYTYPSQAALALAIGLGKMYHNPTTGKTFFAEQQGVRRIF